MTQQTMQQAMKRIAELKAQYLTSHQIDKHLIVAELSKVKDLCIDHLVEEREHLKNSSLLGRWAYAAHPQTSLNPDVYFQIAEMKVEGCRLMVRGEKTCWFSINMIDFPSADCVAEWQALNKEKNSTPP